jgi:hypothetical protein
LIIILYRGQREVLGLFYRYAHPRTIDVTSIGLMEAKRAG